LGFKVAMIALGVLLLTALASAEETLILKTQKDRQSYAMGVEVVRNLDRQGLELDLNIVIRGMKDAAGNKLLLTDDEITKSMTLTTLEVRLKRNESRLTAGEENKKKGEAFLAENKTKEGVVALPSGLQYKILKAGNGEKPTEADAVECRYRGTHIDGTEFDNSERSGAVTTFRVSQAISGWREALTLMPVGSKWRLFIPSQLAYVQRGSGQIGPYETIIYELELVAIK
jgi:FKBP-type peptidyl-prolyl cis-trans isomerase